MQGKWWKTNPFSCKRKPLSKWRRVLVWLFFKEISILQYGLFLLSAILIPRIRKLFFGIRKGVFHYTLLVFCTLNCRISSKFSKNKYISWKFLETVSGNFRKRFWKFLEIKTFICWMSNSFSDTKRTFNYTCGLLKGKSKYCFSIDVQCSLWMYGSFKSKLQAPIFSSTEDCCHSCL